MPTSSLAKHGKLESPWTGVCTTKQQNISVSSRLFLHWIQNPALHQLLRRKWIISQLKPGHLPKRGSGFGNCDWCNCYNSDLKHCSCKGNKFPALLTWNKFSVSFSLAGKNLPVPPHLPAQSCLWVASPSPGLLTWYFTSIYIFSSKPAAEKGRWTAGWVQLFSLQDVIFVLLTCLLPATHCHVCCLPGEPGKSTIQLLKVQNT